MTSLLDLPNETLEHIVEDLMDMLDCPEDKKNAGISLRQTHRRFIGLVEKRVFKEIVFEIAPYDFRGDQNPLWDNSQHPYVKDYTQILTLQCHPIVCTSTGKDLVLKAYKDIAEMTSQLLNGPGSSSIYYSNLSTLEVTDMAAAILLPVILQLAPTLSHIKLDIYDDDGYTLDEFHREIDNSDGASTSTALQGQIVQALTIENFGAGYLNAFLIDWAVRPVSLSLPISTKGREGSQGDWYQLINDLARWSGFQNFEMLASGHDCVCAELDDLDELDDLIRDTLKEQDELITELLVAWEGRGIRMQVHHLDPDWEHILSDFGEDTDLFDVIVEAAYIT